MTSNLNTRGDQNATPEPQSHVPGAVLASFPQRPAQRFGMQPNLSDKGVFKHFLKTGDS